MKRTRSLLLVAVGATLLLGASSGGLAIESEVIANGGSFSSQGKLELFSVVGEPVVGSSASGSLELASGHLGGSAPLQPTSVDDPTNENVPRAFAVRLPTPNPFNPRTQIRLELPHPSPVTVRIYDVRGQVVDELVDASLPAGVHDVTWNGTDQRGRRVASGTYLARIVGVGAPETVKLTLLK